MSDTQRIDKWLWHARVARTRSAAASLVSAGHVRINRARVLKASHAVRLDDVITVAVSHRILVLRVVALVERRGPATHARQTYEDLSPPPPPRPPADGLRPAGTGRPTKRQRRKFEAWRRDIPSHRESTE